MSVEMPTCPVVGRLEYMLVEILDDVEQPDTVGSAVAISPTPGLAYDRAKILLGRPMPVGFHRRCIEIREGRWMDDLVGPIFREEDYRVWFCQVGFRGELLLHLSSKP